MTRKCELCATLAPRVSAAEPAPSRRKRVLVEDRLLLLCAAHARAVEQLGPATLAALHAAFTEPHGQRSLLERRAALDRRAFPARPEGRRASSGRRASDPSP